MPSCKPGGISYPGDATPALRLPPFPGVRVAHYPWACPTSRAGEESEGVRALAKMPIRIPGCSLGGQVRAGGGDHVAKEPTAPWHGTKACRLGSTGVFAAGFWLG